LTYKISFDVGGTFTDFTMLDELSGSVAYHKVSSTPHDPSEAIAQGLEDLIRMHRLDPSAITLLGHGTTVATNLVIERKGARVGLVTTRGFRDVLEIGRQTRPHLYNYRIHRPTPLVARALRLEVEERVMADGRVLTPLNMADLEKAGELFRKAGVTAIAICFLHSYREPAHERRAGEALRQMLPEAYITLSSDVLPEFREFERMSTTVLNAYMGPRMGTYMERLLKRVEAIGIAAEINTVHSNGGLMSVQTVREVPVRTCVSGPAAGVIGTAVIGSMAGYENLVTFDVGGTSTDVSVIVKGRALYASNRLVADYPVKTPMLDIHVIGAGGGSIARIDDADLLEHLADDDLDVLVVDVNALHAVDVLDLFHQIAGQELLALVLECILNSIKGFAKGLVLGIHADKTRVCDGSHSHSFESSGLCRRDCRTCKSEILSLLLNWLSSTIKF
jgi:N-methylhydantoinase A